MVRFRGLAPYLCLDPSSRYVGWAILSEDGKVPAAGRLSRTKGGFIERVDYLTVGVLDLLGEHGAKSAVIEVPSGGVYARHGGRGEGLSIYGFAAGAMDRAVYSRCRGRVHRVAVADWKSGHSKDKARKVAKSHYPAYDPKKDGGADIADAISLAVWFYEFRIRGK